MSGEISYRKYAGSPSPSPRYISDRLAPWYGRWSDGVGYPGATGIAYSGLPKGAAIARITRSVSQFGSIIFEFNEPQNLDGLQLEFQIKAENADAQLYLDITGGPATAWGTLPYGYRLLYGGGSAPTDWAKQSISIGKSSFSIVGGLPLSRDIPFKTCKSLVFYRDVPVAARIIDIADLNIRRL